MYNNTTGSNNTAAGYNAMNANTTGASNTVMGYHAMRLNATGNFNVAVGDSALQASTASNLTAVGSRALRSNTSGGFNTAIGYRAMVANTTGAYNTAIGYEALRSNTTANGNVAIGYFALKNNATAANSIAIGNFALENTNNSTNVAIGSFALQTNITGTDLTAVGHGTIVSADGFINSSVIGNSATINASNKIRLGDAGITVVEGQVAYSFPSDGRFKQDIQDDVKGLDFIMKLEPVSYTFDRLAFSRHIGATPDAAKAESLTAQSQVRQVGFIAQDVERAMAETGFESFDAVHVPENEHDNYSVAYSQFVVPLVKAVQELNTTVEDLKAVNAAQQQMIDALIAELAAMKEKKP
jgi:hypothetical protein